MIDFVCLLTHEETNILVNKLVILRQKQGLLTNNDEILVLVSWARAIRRNERLLSLLLMDIEHEMLLDVDYRNNKVRIVNNDGI